MFCLGPWIRSFVTKEIPLNCQFAPYVFFLVSCPLGVCFFVRYWRKRFYVYKRYKSYAPSSWSRTIKSSPHKSYSSKHATSFWRQQRCDNVETTSCDYWDRPLTFQIRCIFEKKSKQIVNKLFIFKWRSQRHRDEFEMRFWAHSVAFSMHFIKLVRHANHLKIITSKNLKDLGEAITCYLDLFRTT